MNTVNKNTLALAMSVGLLAFSGHADQGVSNEDLINDAAAGKIAEVEALLKAGADPNFSGPSTYTVLMHASTMNRPEIVRILINAGADVNKTNNLGETALMQASAAAFPEVVAVLLQAKAKVKLVANDGSDALQWAASGGDNEIVKMLLAAGAPINHHDSKGQTAISVARLCSNEPSLVAMRQSYRNIVATLLAAKAAQAKRQAKNPVITK